MNREDFKNLLIHNNTSTNLEKNFNLNYTKEYFGIIENNKILGYTYVDLFFDISFAKINQIYINSQNLDYDLIDGLIRTIFHYLHINCLKYSLIIYNDNIEQFLIKNKEINMVNYENLPNEIKIITEKNSYNKYYVCNINKFFKHKCNSINQI